MLEIQTLRSKNFGLGFAGRVIASPHKLVAIRARTRVGRRPHF